MARKETKNRKTLVKAVSVVKNGNETKKVAIRKVRDMKHRGFIDPNESPTVGISKTTSKKSSKKKGK